MRKKSVGLMIIVALLFIVTGCGREVVPDQETLTANQSSIKGIGLIAPEIREKQPTIERLNVALIEDEDEGNDDLEDETDNEMEQETEKDEEEKETAVAISPKQKQTETATVKEETKKEVTPEKENPKTETVKSEPKKETVKEEPKKETVKEEPKKETVKEEPKKETVKEEPKKEERNFTQAELDQLKKDLLTNPFTQVHMVFDRVYAPNHIILRVARGVTNSIHGEVAPFDHWSDVHFVYEHTIETLNKFGWDWNDVGYGETSSAFHIFVRADSRGGK